MFEVYRKEITYGGRKLIFETGKIARQADRSQYQGHQQAYW